MWLNELMMGSLVDVSYVLHSDVESSVVVVGGTGVVQANETVLDAVRAVGLERWCRHWVCAPGMIVGRREPGMSSWELAVEGAVLPDLKALPCL